MRGSDTRSGELFSYVDLEQRIPANHPLRKIRQLVNDVLMSLDAEFAKLYSAFGRAFDPARAAAAAPCCCRPFSRSAPSGS